MIHKQLLAYRIANKLLNRNMIRSGIKPSQVEAAINGVLRAEGIGQKKMHFRDFRVGWADSLCRRARRGQNLLLTEIEEHVTCLRCRAILEKRRSNGTR